MREPVLPAEQIQDVAGRAAASTSIDGEALFEEVFGLSWDDYSADHLG